MATVHLLCLLVVVAHSSALSFPPEIKEGPENLIQVDGSEVVMRCRVAGEPRPTIKWLREDVELTGRKYNLTADGDLVIRKVGYGDAGQYRCYAQNSFGEKSAYGSLDIKQRTVIVNKPSDVEVAAGQQVTFRCTPNFDPNLPSSVIWEFQGLPIDFTSQPRFRMGNDYSLAISGAVQQDAGLYACVARTVLDTARAQATLTIRA